MKTGLVHYISFWLHSNLNLSQLVKETWKAQSGWNITPMPQFTQLLCMFKTNSTSAFTSCFTLRKEGEGLSE